MLLHLKSTCDVNLLSKLSIIFKEWRVTNNVDRGGVIVLFVNKRNITRTTKLDLFLQSQIS
jgi:hypothetical protein